MWSELFKDQGNLTKVKELPWSQLYAEDELLNTHYLALRKSQSLVAMVWAAWLFGLAVAGGAAKAERQSITVPRISPSCFRSHPLAKLSKVPLSPP